MGSSRSAATDCSIGPIVWVRRRNGSWWPGKIMEPDELAECNLTSPRTGTPVKLLGREDASVDWYNLEKSKRVKAFRCGEFDDCIEKAESAPGMPIKKREKYARREDAILHALELEKELLGKQGKSVLASDVPRSKAFVNKEHATIPEALENNIEEPGNVKLIYHLKGGDANINNEIVGNPVHLWKARDGDQPLLEDDHGEVTPRMRGLQDFGLRTTSLKRKLSTSADSDDSDKLMAVNHSQGPVDVPSTERRNLANGEDQVIPQTKRSRIGYMPAESSDSEDKGCHPSQDKMSPEFEDDDGDPHQGSLNQENSSSGFMEDVGTDSSDYESSESESDSSETEPDIDESAFSDAAIPAEQDALGRSALEEHGSSSSDDPFLVNEAVSKWQLKRKRNNRHLTSKSGDRANSRGFYGPLRGIHHRIKGSSLGKQAYGLDDSDYEEDYRGTQMVGLDTVGCSYTSRFSSRNQNKSSRNIIDWDDRFWEDRPFFRGRWEDRREFFNPIFNSRHHFGGRSRSMLIDVDLKVQASYQKERVPIVSLTSMLDDKAIIGHPIQIEALEDGSSETLISTSFCYGNELVDHDGSAPLPPAWRTARRTNFRVPRPHLPSVLAVDTASKEFSFVDQERVPFKKSSMGSFNHKDNLVRKSIPQVPRPPSDRKLPKKMLKKALSSNQKTRTLSSIGVQQSYGFKPKLNTSGSQLDGLIKPETPGLTTVACIPVKLVFSRLLEKINRPPSKAAASKMVMPNRDAKGQPS